MHLLTLIGNFFGFTDQKSLFYCQKGSTTPAIKHQDQENTVLPDELITEIFNHLGCLHSKSLADKEHLLPLLRCAQVCRQFRRIADDYFSKIFLSHLAGELKPTEMSWPQTLGLYYNWKKQPAKLTLISFSPAQFQPINCHVRIDNPAITYDIVEVGVTRVLLIAQRLMGKSKSTLAWKLPVENPEKRLFVSYDLKLVATQHYSHHLGKNGKTRLVCRFDVRNLETGRLLGNVTLLCPDGKKVYDDFNVKFDLTQFTYQIDGEVKTRHYDPCL